ncbi:hypothetical protein TrRE_jg10529 [Triparma retinervis]|uniref:Uncharacterized protein n=1 Tax=Triparma retinervis TaxID=2557542 RepID=A0A9W6ZN71_9STRA|nr:hypothetical protein TrRE_jg10529 [Triparma retinervis]
MGLFWRVIFFSTAFVCQAYFISYAVTGERVYRMRGQAFLPISAGAMIMFIFAAPRCCGWGDIRTMGGFALWLATFQISVAIGHLVTNPSGDKDIGMAFLSMLVWFDPVVVYLFARMRKRVAALLDEDLSLYLLENLLFLGLPGFAPLLYLCLDTFNCLNLVDEGLTETDQHYDECSGVLVPQFSISFFFFFLLVCNVVIAPLSDISMKAVDIMQMRIGLRLSAVLFLVSIAAFGNIFLFANMYAGRRTTFMMQTAMCSGMSCVFAAVLEMFHIAWTSRRKPERGSDEGETDLFEEEEGHHLPLNELHKQYHKRGTRSSRSSRSSRSIRSSNHSSEGPSSPGHILEYSIKDRNLMSSSISDSVGLG